MFDDPIELTDGLYDVFTDSCDTIAFMSIDKGWIGGLDINWLFISIDFGFFYPIHIVFLNSLEFWEF